MTTVTERRVETNQNIVIAPTANTAAIAAVATASTTNSSEHSDDGKGTPTTGTDNRSAYLNSDIGLKPTSISAQITGILKGGKLWKHEQQQVISNFLHLSEFLSIYNHGIRLTHGILCYRAMKTHRVLLLPMMRHRSVRYASLMELIARVAKVPVN